MACVWATTLVARPTVLQGSVDCRGSAMDGLSTHRRGTLTPVLQPIKEGTMFQRRLSSSACFVAVVVMALAVACARAWAYQATNPEPQQAPNPQVNQAPGPAQNDSKADALGPAPGQALRHWTVVSWPAVGPDGTIYFFSGYPAKVALYAVKPDGS